MSDTNVKAAQVAEMVPAIPYEVHRELEASYVNLIKSGLRRLSLPARGASKTIVAPVPAIPCEIYRELEAEYVNLIKSGLRQLSLPARGASKTPRTLPGLRSGYWAAIK